MDSFAQLLKAHFDDYLDRVTPEQLQADYDKSGAARYAAVHLPGSVLFPQPVLDVMERAPAVPRPFRPDCVAETFSPPGTRHPIPVAAATPAYALAA